MTHDATILDLPGGANIATAAGDVAEFFATGTNTVQCVNYTKRDGTAIVAGAGGDSRNFIIDGGMDIWPTGTSFTTISSSQYISSLFRIVISMDELVVDLTRSTDVPTLAQSGYNSLYSLKVDVTTAESANDANDICYLQYRVTGLDYQALHQKEVTLAFWVKTTKTGTYGIAFANSAGNRGYATDYTVSSADTWEYKTVTVTLDTTGTWLFDEGIGLVIAFGLQIGADKDVTPGSWSGADIRGSSNQVTALDNTANNFLITQVGLYLGATAPASFLAEPIATVQDQVEYYVQRFDYDTTAYETVAMGSTTSTTVYDLDMRLRRYMRKVPSVAFTAADTFNGIDNNNGSKVGTGITTFGIQQDRFTLRLTCGATGVVGAGAIRRDSSDTCNITVDARH
jgi:hypothetical protein